MTLIGGLNGVIATDRRRIIVDTSGNEHRVKPRGVIELHEPTRLSAGLIGAVDIGIETSQDQTSPGIPTGREYLEWGRKMEVFHFSIRHDETEYMEPVSGQFNQYLIAGTVRIEEAQVPPWDFLPHLAQSNVYEMRQMAAAHPELPPWMIDEYHEIQQRFERPADQESLQIEGRRKPVKHWVGELKTILHDCGNRLDDPDQAKLLRVKLSGEGSVDVSMPSEADETWNRIVAIVKGLNSIAVANMTSYYLFLISSWLEGFSSETPRHDQKAAGITVAESLRRYVELSPLSKEARRFKSLYDGFLLNVQRNESPLEKADRVSLLDEDMDSLAPSKSKPPAFHVQDIDGEAGTVHLWDSKASDMIPDLPVERMGIRS